MRFKKSVFFSLFLFCFLSGISIAKAQKVILQGFHVGRHWDGTTWSTNTTNGVPCPLDPKSIKITDTWHYDRIAKQASLIASSGFTAIWLAPMSKGNQGGMGTKVIFGGIYDAGYGLYDDYDLGDKLQNGNYQTRYGSRTQLTRSIAMLRANGIDVYEDFILNHRSITPNNKPVAPDYLWYSYKNAYDSVGGGRFPKYTLDFHNSNNYPGAPGGKSDPHTPSLVYPDGTPTGDADGGFGPDFGHITGQRDVHGIDGVYCAEQLNRWGDWLIRATGIQGYRLDAVGGISWDWLKNFVNFGAMKGKFSISEMLTQRYGPNHIRTWMRESMGQTGSNFTSYDFALQGALHNLCRTNRFWMGVFLTKHLSHGTFNSMNPAAGTVDPGIYDPYRSMTVSIPDQSVTVVNEIDTETSTNPLLPKQSLLGYAYILTIGYGVPCVSYKDWSTDDDCYGSTMLDEHNLNYHLNKLIWCHKFLCTGNMTSEYTSPNGWVYSFEKTGGQAMVFMNSNQDVAQKVNAPTTIPNGTILTDYTDHNVTATVVGGKISITVPANKNGRGYLVMAPAGKTGSFAPEQVAVTQEWEGNKDLSIPPASNRQQEVCRIWVDNDKTITSILLDYNTEKWAENANLHIEINKTSLDNKSHLKVASRTFNSTQKGQTLTYNTPTGGGPGYYSVWIKGNNLPDSTSNWWFNLQNTYTSSKTAPAAFNDTIPTLVKATKVFIPDTVETDKENIGLYPNPVHDTLNAVYQLTASSTVTVRVFDITGKMLMKIDEGKRAAGQNKIIINVSGLTANVYIVQVLANSKKVMAKKFIKQ